MNNFDLRKYLAENPLLKEGLSNQEQDIVDDILSVTEGLNDILNKMKGYAKKGLLTLAIVTSVVGQLKAQGQTDLANQVEKASTELVVSNDINSYGPEFLNLNSIFDNDKGKFRFIGNVTPFNSEKGQRIINNWGLTYNLILKNSKIYKDVPKTVKIENIKYNVNIYSTNYPGALYKVEYVNSKTNEINSNFSFFYEILIDKEKQKAYAESSPLGKLKSLGWKVVQTTTNGTTTIVVLKRGNSYQSLTLNPYGNVTSKTTSF